MERFVAGSSEAIEAEFGVTDEHTNRPFVLVAFYDNETQWIEGFETKEDMKAFLKENPTPNVEYFY
jgi:hypothetical protein